MDLGIESTDATVIISCSNAVGVMSTGIDHVSNFDCPLPKLHHDTSKLLTLFTRE